MSVQVWTPARDKLLIDGYNAGHSYEKLADLCDCAYKTIHSRMKRLRSLGLVGVRQDFSWTDEHIQYLIDNYPHKRTEVVCAALGRSKASVGCKARSLGLSKSEAHVSMQRQLAAQRQRKRSTGKVATHHPKPVAFTVKPCNRAQEAASYLQKWSAVWRCDADGKTDINGSHFMYLGRVRTPDEIIERAKAKKWQPWDLAA